jgi:hypothetical protein
VPDITDYWADGPGGGTPITAANQNAREEAIFDAATAYADSVSDKRVDLPTGYLYENMDRRSITNTAAIGAGLITCAGWVVVRAGVAITSITFGTGGGTAMASPTNQWFGIQDASNEQVVAVTTDDTTAAWANNTTKTLSISGGPWTPGSDMLVRGLICVAATTAPTLQGLTGSATAQTVLQLAPKSIYRDTTSRTSPVAVGTTLTPNSSEFRTPWFGFS